VGKEIDYSVYLVTDDYYLNMDGVHQVIEMALQNGVTLMQYRAKEYSSRKMLQDARILRELCWKYDVPLIVNDRLDIALAVDADGLHVGQDDLPLDVVRRYIGKKIIGVSATSYEEAKDAILQGADYVGVGPVFPTLTKKDAKPVCGMEVIRKLKREFPGAPLIAIGGIDLANIKQVIEAGVDGVAIISAILGSEDKSAAVRQFAQIFAEAGRTETES
jgi:thiamine-phosphate pyrophosphorylase